VAFTRPPHDACDLAWEGQKVYSYPAVNGVNFSFAPYNRLSYNQADATWLGQSSYTSLPYDNAHATFSTSTSSCVYSPPDSSAIEFNIEAGYGIPSGDNVSFNFNCYGLTDNPGEVNDGSVKLEATTAFATILFDESINNYTLDDASALATILFDERINNYTLDSVDFDVKVYIGTLWTNVPQMNFVEVVEWKTDVIRTKSSEQRVSIRTTPRQLFELNFILTPQQFNEMRRIVYVGTQSISEMPIWSQRLYFAGVAPGSSVLAVPRSNHCFVNNDKAVVIYPNMAISIVDVTAVTDTHVTLSQSTSDYPEFWLLPMRKVFVLSGGEFKREGNEVITGSITFEMQKAIACTKASPFTAYAGMDVMTDRSIVVSSMKEKLIWETDDVQFTTGSMRRFKKYDRPEYQSTISWEFRNLGERMRVLPWVNSLRGKQRAFWLPSWNKDFELHSSVVSNSTTITVKSLGPYVEGTLHIMLQSKAGVRYYRQVTSVNRTVSPPTMTLNQSIGVNIAVNDVGIICMLRKVRLDSDRLEIQHVSNGMSTLTVPVVEVA